MEFILNDYHRNILDEELIADLVAVSVLLKKDTISREEYNKYGKYHSSTIEKRFDAWPNALELAGLTTYQKLNNWCNSLDEFVADVKNVAQQLRLTTLTIGEYRQHGKYNYLYPHKHGGIGWNEILNRANLEQTKFRLGSGKEITNEELFFDIERVWILLGRQPTITDIKKGYFKFSQNTFCRRFGGWRNALIEFVNFINSEENVEMNKSTETIAVDKYTKEEVAVANRFFHRRGNREPNLRMRFKIMQRDNFKCCKCGRSPATDPSVQLVIDHKHPWAQGGETTFDNLETLCKECNLGKSDLI